VNQIPDQYLDLFERPVSVSLATMLSDGTPQVQPVWCSFDGTHLLVNTEKGRQKYRNLSRRRRATILACRSCERQPLGRDTRRGRRGD